MKHFLFFVFVCSSILYGCKCRQPVVVNTTNADQSTPAPKTTTGKVSHQYRATGCATVIIVNLENQENPLVLIPKDKLESKFDVDGMEILFNYHTLRMPQPAGCSKGIPAEITDITIK